MVCFGTRPEAIKLAPIIFEAKNRGLEVRVIVSGQHREMLKPFLDFFEITPDINLEVLKPNQHLSDLTASIFSKMRPILEQDRPDLMFVQGDTTTTFACALSAFYEKIPVAHVEAGLRTHDRYSPFPEEMNRLLVGRVAAYHFAPTARAFENLKNEGTPGHCSVTGNTGVDALRLTSEKLKAKISGKQQSILITAHRRENHGKPLARICDAVVELIHRFPECNFVLPVHLNPNVQSIVREKLGSYHQVQLLPPLDYLDFVGKMMESTVILTDSGGVQEEAPYLKKPIFVLRESTERQEGVEAGVAELVGTETQKIVDCVSRALTDSAYYQSFQKAVSPYGDGFAAQKIFQQLFQQLFQH